MLALSIFFPRISRNCGNTCMGWSSAKWLGTLFSLQAPLSLASTGKINAHQPAQKSFVHVCKQRQLCTPMREQQQTMCGQQQTMHEQQQAMSG